ncbi:MAG: DUF2842 domain-containing protein [Alkalilacustris sp.]
MQTPKLSYKARRIWSVIILVVGLPIYILVAVAIMANLDRPHFLIEALIYLALGVLWALPLKFVFTGVGQADPDARRED